MRKRISFAAIHALKEALSRVYWYKTDLRSFLSQCLSETEILKRLNWNEYKRNIVETLVSHLTTDEEKHQRDLIRLMSEICEINDFSHLLKLEDGKEKAELAEKSVEVLRSQMKGYQDLQLEEREVERRRQEALKRSLQVSAVQKKLNEIRELYYVLVGGNNPQKRGYDLEKILRDLFELFDLDPKASFKLIGEQIDGAFSFEGTDYLLEAKWQKDPVSAKELDSLVGKLSRKLDNTLGLFLSINAYTEDAVKVHSSGRRLVILMDGSDLMAVLEGRIDLVQLLLRKRRNASQTGNIYMKIHDILG